MKKRLLSKSRYLNGLQCLKYLWVVFNDKEKISPPDASTQHTFDEGHRIGELAKQLFPNGINISSDNFTENLDITKKLLSANRPLFEPGFYVDNCFSRLDVLYPLGDGSWDIYEVKGSTQVKDLNIHDIAFQRHCVQRAGLSIRNCHIVHINNQYIKDGEIDPQQLFTIEDITDQADEVARDIVDRAENMWETIASPNCPDTRVGPHCSNPYPCPISWCWESLPENNIFDLAGGGRKCFELLDRGILFIKEIPEEYSLSKVQQIQKACEIDGQIHLDKESIREFLNSLEYPLYYLDFETFNPAIPVYNGTRPYQRVPFQFSLHMVEKPESEPRYFGFLSDDTEDPRLDFLNELQRLLGNQGNIIVYNQSFEKGVLSELGTAFPKYNPWVEETKDRIVDLYAPFRSFSYYNPTQEGSASLKKVLPALTGKDYSALAISNGDDASLSFFNMVMGSYSDEEKSKIMNDLEEYCALDTGGMILIVDELDRLCT